MRTLSERFWSKVNRGDPGKCWEWRGCIQPNGYGRIHDDGATRSVHRVAVKLDGREIPDGKQVNHHCDNRSCVNPEHLYVGTQKENRQDAVERGRTATGEDNGKANLDWQDVGAIRREYALTSKTQYDLADDYDVTHGNISKIVRGKIWSQQ